MEFNVLSGGIPAKAGGINNFGRAEKFLQKAEKRTIVPGAAHEKNGMQKVDE